MLSVFVAGNELLEKDSLALKVMRALEKEKLGVEFRAIESLGELEKIPEELWIIDVAAGIKKVELLGLEKIVAGKKVSLHDFDLGTELLLYKKLGKLEKAKIIAIPSDYALEKAVEETRAILLSKSG